MRCIFFKQTFLCLALLSTLQIAGSAARADWHEAYQAPNGAEQRAAPAPTALDPTIAAALDENLDLLGRGDRQEPSLVAETEAKAASPVLLASFLESVASSFNTSRCDSVGCDSVSCSSTGRRSGGLLPPWRPYVGGIVGATFATLDDDNPQTPAISNESVFTAGCTIGVAFYRPMGALRVEFEGRGRDQISTTDSEPGLGSLTQRATDIWSATINVWRDYQPYESLGFYAGGGIGSGGYRSTISGTGLASVYTGNDPVTNFAWQAGGGVFYNLTKRATIDLGYRFFAIDESTAVAEVFQQPFTYRERYSASELLLTLRIYEPFQRWW